MYSLKEAWLKMHGHFPYEGWEGNILCNDTDAAITFRTNKTQGFISAYTFTLVLKGWLSIHYNDIDITLVPGDLYVYLPGLPVSVISSSEDYRGICLLVDERLTVDIGAERDLSGVVFRPVVELHEPKLHLPQATASSLHRIMGQIRDYGLSANKSKEGIMRHLYAVFLYELKNFLDISSTDAIASRRQEEQYITFLKLLPANFELHHDILYYADAMGITPIYLSRIVRKMSGRTVVGHIHDLLLSEAKMLLKSTGISVTQIADRLHFADTSSFSRFFSRMTGISPRRYRDAGNATVSP